jgi:hypothetical protein
MGLFTKKDPCAICGGKVKSLLPWKVDGQLVCNPCFARVDLPIDMVNKMTMDEFRGYMAFRSENEQLKQQFQTTHTVDLGVFADKIVFDTVNGLFCMKADLTSTIFEKKNIKSFVIREDGAPLYEGSAAGLVCYTSTVPDRVAFMSPMLQQIRMMKERERQEEMRAKREGNDNYIHRSYNDVEEPFEKFLIEIHCEHPYWKLLTAERNGPTFDNERPYAQEYLRQYQEGAESMGQLARALMELAFPGAPEQRAGGNVTVVGQSVAAAPATSTDVVAEIQRFKELVDLGVITEEEFTAKKRQLLGI